MYIIIGLIIFILWFLFLKPKNTSEIERLARQESLHYSPQVQANGNDIIEITIVDGVPTTNSTSEQWKERQAKVLNYIKTIMEKFKSKINCKLIIGLEDGYMGDKGICVFSKKSNGKNTLIPDAYAMNEYGGILTKNDPYVYKIPKAIFVGFSTGNNVDLKKNERLSFSNWALDQDGIDSYITGIVQINEEMVSTSYPRYKEFINNYIPEEEQMKYKYIISIDGNGPAWNRVPWILNSNSILIKKTSEMINWYYPLLKENYHYISFDTNESILGELKNNNDEIVENAHKFVKDYLDKDSQMLYMYNVIKNISSNQ